MTNEIVLRPEELFFLGNVMHAANQDYSYIASMGEICRNYAQTEQKCLLNLSRMGVIRQRLSGEISVRPQVEGLLKKVFFGELETKLDVVTTGENPTHQGFRFHYLDGGITMVTASGGSFILREVTEADVEARIRRVAGSHREPDGRPVRLDRNSITRVIAVQRGKKGVGTADELFFEQEDALYTTDSAGRYVGVSDAAAAEIMIRMLKENEL